MLLDNKNKMAADLVDSATNKDLTDTDWTRNIEICELVSNDPRQAKDVIKAIKKRVGGRNPRTQLFAVKLLEMLMNNIGENIHREVIHLEVLPILVKIVKKKADTPARERIFFLLDATQTSLGGASGKFPQYYTAYYDLVSAGVKFPQRTQSVTANESSRMDIINNGSSIPASGLIETNGNSRHEPKAAIIPEPSILEKAGNALEVLRDVLEAVDARNPEAARDEFTLDLVEQCSFQKQRVMHLAINSGDEKVVSRAVELNEELQKVLTRHDAFLSMKSASTASICNTAHIQDDPEQMLRLKKGKALVEPDYGNEALCKYAIRPALIPPPPARRAEREKFFQEHQMDGVRIADRMRTGLSLHSRDASSSHSDSFSSSD